MRSKADAMPLPNHVFRVRSGTKVYYYYQKRRGYPDAGKCIRLPEPNSPEWFEALAAAMKQKPEPPEGTLSTVWHAYINGPRKPKTEGTLRTYKPAWRILETAWGNIEPRKLTAPKIAELHDGLANTPTMANMVLTVLRLLLGEAKRLGLVETNAAADLRPHEVDIANGAKPFTPEAWAAITSDACPRPVYRLAILMRATGQRISDAHKLTPAMRERNGFRHGIKKRARKISSHWSLVAPEWLRIIDGWECFPNAPYVNCEGRMTEAKLRILWNAFAATDEGAALRGFRSHDLRATNFCDHILAGDSIDDIARIRNVSPGKVRSYTQHLRPEDFAAARAKGA